jgi:hypothetical protein
MTFIPERGHRSGGCGARDAARRAPRVVIVTPSYISANPRVLKEADALSDGGFDVHVVFGQRGTGDARDHDEALLAGRRWHRTAVRSARSGSEILHWGFSAASQRVSQFVPETLWGRGVFAERACGRLVPALARAAIRQKGDLYIGHYPEGLAAAGIAAAKTKSMLGFDAEDFHTGEPNSLHVTARTDFIQRRYLPRCSWATAASPGIAKLLSERYGIKEPITIYNVFPLFDRGSIDGECRDRQSDALSLYWYSQTIGLDRAAGRLGAPVQIHIRGSLEGSVRDALRALAQECNVTDSLHFHGPVSPSELLSRAVEHDVGLALEQPTTLNRAVCTTNKLFFYFLAGLAIAATDVPGQRVVLSDHNDASAMYAPGDVEGLCAILERWRTVPLALRNAKAAALRAAEQTWNWERESAKLVEHASALFASREQRVQRSISSNEQCLTA